MIPEEMENEFLSLVNNTSMKDLFKQEENISDFWAAISSQYLKIGLFTLRVLLSFVSFLRWKSSTYLWEKGFSTLLNIKSKAINKLEEERDIRCALSKTLPNISDLVSKKLNHINKYFKQICFLFSK